MEALDLQGVGVGMGVPWDNGHVNGVVEIRVPWVIEMGPMGTGLPVVGLGIPDPWGRVTRRGLWHAGYLLVTHPVPTGECG